MSEFTQGVCADGAAILKDGVMLTIEEIIELLRQGAAILDAARKLNPRLWTKEENEAWHSKIPDIYAAFEALRNATAAIKGEG